jgi:hypothetical protein
MSLATVKKVKKNWPLSPVKMESTIQESNNARKLRRQPKINYKHLSGDP